MTQALGETVTHTVDQVVATLARLLDRRQMLTETDQLRAAQEFQRLRLLVTQYQALSVGPSAATGLPGPAADIFVSERRMVVDVATMAQLVGFPGSEEDMGSLASFLPRPVLAYLGPASGQATPIARALSLTEPRIAGRETTEAYLFTTDQPEEFVVVLADDVQVLDVWTTTSDALIRACRDRERDLRRVISQLQDKPRRSALRR